MQKSSALTVIYFIPIIYFHVKAKRPTSAPNSLCTHIHLRRLAQGHNDRLACRRISTANPLVIGYATLSPMPKSLCNYCTLDFSQIVQLEVVLSAR